eukprot:3318679-Rhodomonas_salina.3
MTSWNACSLTRRDRDSACSACQSRTVTHLTTSTTTTITDTAAGNSRGRKLSGGTCQLEA